MKPLCLAILVLSLVALSSCSSFPDPVKDATIVKVVETGMTKAESFDLSMRWVAQTFVSMKSVVEYSDKDAGTINVKGNTSVGPSMGIDVRVDFALIIDLKDTKARLSFTALSYANAMYPLAKNPIYPSIFESFKPRTDELAADFLSFLQKSNTTW